MFYSENCDELFYSKNNDELSYSENDGEFFHSRNNGGELFCPENNGGLFYSENDSELFCKNGRGICQPVSSGHELPFLVYQTSKTSPERGLPNSPFWSCDTCLSYEKDRFGVRLWVSYFELQLEVCNAVNIAVENENWPYTIDMWD